MEEVLGYSGGDAVRGRRRSAEFVEIGIGAEVEDPLKVGRGYGIVGSKEFIEKIRERYLSATMQTRELPAVRRIVRRVAPERIIGVVCKEMEVRREEVMRRGYGGLARGLLMEFLYRYGGMNQREIGELMGVDYSAVSVGRKRFEAERVKDRRLLQDVEKIKKLISQG